MLLYFKPDVIMVAEVPDDFVAEISVGAPCPLCVTIGSEERPIVTWIDYQAGYYACTQVTSTRHHVLSKDDKTVRVNGLDMLASDGRVFHGRVAKIN